MIPRLARTLVIAAAVVAVLVAAVERGHPATKGALELRYVYSPDAEQLLAPLIARFNREAHTSGGREIEITGVSLTSGEAEATLAARRDQATLWTPASSLWGRLLNHAGLGRVGAVTRIPRSSRRRR